MPLSENFLIPMHECTHAVSETIHSTEYPRTACNPSVLKWRGLCAGNLQLMIFTRYRMIDVGDDRLRLIINLDRPKDL